MKVKLIKPVDTETDFYGISILAETLQEKQLIRKLGNADFSVKFSEKASANLIRKKVTLQLTLEVPV